MIIYNASLNKFRNHVTLNLMSNILLENLRLKGLSGGSPSEVNVWNNFRIANQSVKKRRRHRINPKTATTILPLKSGRFFWSKTFLSFQNAVALAHFKIVKPFLCFQISIHNIENGYRRSNLITAGRKSRRRSK